MTWSIGVCCQAQCSAAAAASVASPLPHRERWQQPAEIDAGPASLRMIEADAADDLSGRLLDDRPLPVAAQFPLSDHVAGVSGREVETGGRLAQRDLLARDHLGIPEDAHERLGVRELRQPQHEPPGFDRGRKLVHPGVNLPDVEARDSLIYDRRMQLLTYLNYAGNCAEAFRFYEQHLGGRITMMMKHGEGPDKSQVPPGLKDAVLHARMTIGGTDLLGADVPPDRFQPMRSAYLTLTLDSTADAERIYALLSDSGEVFMPIQETFFAFRFAMLRDKFGTSWMLLHERPRPNS